MTEQPQNENLLGKQEAAAQPEGAQPGILPSVPMAVFLAQVEANASIKGRWEREIAVVNVMKAQVGDAHALIASKEIDLQYANLRIAELEKRVAELQLAREEKL